MRRGRRWKEVAHYPVIHHLTVSFKVFPIRSESTSDFSQASFSLLLWTIKAASRETDWDPNQVSGTCVLSSLTTAWSQPRHQSVCSFVVLEIDVFALSETCRKISSMLILAPLLIWVSFISPFETKSGSKGRHLQWWEQDRPTSHLFYFHDSPASAILCGKALCTWAKN